MSERERERGSRARDEGQGEGGEGGGVGHPAGGGCLRRQQLHALLHGRRAVEHRRPGRPLVPVVVVVLIFLVFRRLVTPGVDGERRVDLACVVALLHAVADHPLAVSCAAADLLDLWVEAATVAAMEVKGGRALPVGQVDCLAEVQVDVKVFVAPGDRGVDVLLAADEVFAQPVSGLSPVASI